MSNYRNKCIIKMFDIPVELIEAELQEYRDNDDISFEISEKYKDITINIVNKNASDIVFDSILRKLGAKFSAFIYADSDITLAEHLVRKLKKLGKRISVAESLTGGLIASSIVSVSGASQVFYEGMVTYNPGAKVRRLHVSLPLIEKQGTVNAEVARAMTIGLFDNKEIDYAFSTTGIAGPDSDEFNTPVGRVYIGYGEKTYVEVKELNLVGSRDEIRHTAVNYAIFFMLRYINKSINKEGNTYGSN